MEKEIAENFFQIECNDKIEQYANERKEEIDYPLKLNLSTNYKTILDFNDKYFDKYEYTLLINAIIYNLEHNPNSRLLNDLKNNINNIREYINSSLILRAKIIQDAISNIKLISYKDKGKIKINKDPNLKVINNYKAIFDKINEQYINVNSITEIYRKTLFKFLDVYNRYDITYYLNVFLTSNKLDKAFLQNNNLITKDNLFEYKRTLIRMILSDNYLIIESDLHEKDIDDLITDIKLNYYDEDNDDCEDEDEVEEEIRDLENDKEILEFITNCIENNTYCLPKNNRIKNMMLENFIDYNNINSKEYEISVVEENKEKKLNLIKINPLYKLDLFK